MSCIYVIDDEKNMHEVISGALKNVGFEVNVFAEAQEALEQMKKKEPVLVISDIRMGMMSGFDVFTKVKEMYPEVNVILITAYASVETAVSALRKGVFDYLTKPFKINELRETVNRALSEKKLDKEIFSGFMAKPIMGSSEAIKHIMQCVEKVAPTDSTVLISGESGTGKELIARAIHGKSLRSSKPFVSVNCAALPDTLLESELFGHEKGSFTGAVKTKIGLFEYANGGTLFLDEVGDVSSAVQVKLLRVLQEREIRRVGGLEDIVVDVRVVSATSRDLKQDILEGKFREDLFYRLNVIPIEVPGLRFRKDDIAVLVNFFADNLSKKTGKKLAFSKEAVQVLCDYDWPGNIRELENTIERVCALSENDFVDEAVIKSIFSKESLGVELIEKKAVSILKEETDSIERAKIKEALAESDGNKKKAAEILNISRQSLNYKLRKHGFFE